MGDFTMFKCKRQSNVLTQVMYERHLTPLEIIFNLKFDVNVLDKGLSCPTFFFYQHLRQKLGLYNIENELRRVNWPEGWKFSSYNTRYTYEHSWEAIRQRGKPSNMGIDIVLSAPNELKQDRKRLKKESQLIADKIAQLTCFQPSEYIKLVSRSTPKPRKKKNG